MKDYPEELQEEINYLDKTVRLLQYKLDSEAENLSERKRKLVAMRKDMWENTSHSAYDFTKQADMNQYLFEINQQTEGYTNSAQRAEKYKRMLATPYFGRFDFKEEGFEREKIYLGLGNVIDPKTQEVYVYDWRAPISSIFYQYEVGKAAYEAPGGWMGGEVFLKRQYKITDSKLRYFFDSSVRITDDILQEVLSHNSSSKMRNIVETIQKEQDQIIRDTEHELLIVQGVAGSGKTSIALHRIAYLLYQGLNTNLNAHNVLILSPNEVFSQYISSVLPELGEENVRQITFQDILTEAFQGQFKLETREQQLETLIQLRDEKKGAQERGQLKHESIAFKGSRTFMQILDRLIWHYGHHVIPFEDVYFNGITVATKQQIKARFLNNEIGIPMAKQMKRIEKTLLDRVHPVQKKRLEKITQIVARNPEHLLEIKSFSRLLAIREAKALLERIQRFTTVDYRELYASLFKDQKLFFKLAEGLDLPQNIKQLLSLTQRNLEKGQINYEDYEEYAPLLYLKLKLEGNDSFTEIRQVVIDEAQDYVPLQYEVFKLLFKNAQYTVLGDIHQTLEKEADLSLYAEISEILHKTKTAKLDLKKGYRSSYEINAFTQKLLGIEHEAEGFERHGDEPKVVYQETQDLMDQAILRDLAYYKGQGYESLAVICKTGEEAKNVYSRLLKKVQELSGENELNIHLIENHEGQVEKGAMVIPSYTAKGLEFDVVIVYNADKSHYDTDFDRKLLYVASTRALHQLVIYFSGEKSRLF